MDKLKETHLAPASEFPAIDCSNCAPEEGRVVDSDEARRITRMSDAVRPYVEHVLDKVTKAAKEGKREVVDPLNDVEANLGRLTTYAKENVRRAIVSKGFNWKFRKHDGDTYGPDADGEYIKVSW